jgi:enoyl-[acyl-carrier protein] reductase I
MKLLDGKKGLIVGVANNKSLAWGISKAAHDHGAQLAFTYLNESLERRVTPLAHSVESELILRCDVRNDEDVAHVFASLEKEWGGLDFVVHSVAYAHADDLGARFTETSRQGFAEALEISAYSLVTLAKFAYPLLRKNGGSLLSLSYYGAVKVVPHYRVMGVAKAALEACVRELACDLGPEGIRVNAISSGPIRTLAASGIADFRQLLSLFEDRAPLRHLVNIEEVGDVGVYLLSDLARAVTGEVHYVDCGFNITAV